jgi:hypothetical protein
MKQSDGAVHLNALHPPHNDTQLLHLALFIRIHGSNL